MPRALAAEGRRRPACTNVRGLEALDRDCRFGIPGDVDGYACPRDRRIVGGLFRDAGICAPLLSNQCLWQHATADRHQRWSRSLSLSVQRTVRGRLLGRVPILYNPGRRSGEPRDDRRALPRSVPATKRLIRSPANQRCLLLERDSPTVAFCSRNCRATLALNRACNLTMGRFHQPGLMSLP